MIIKNKFDFGDTVYVKTDCFQSPRMVLSIEVYKNGEVMYVLGQGTDTSKHYEFELSVDENTLLKIES